jgi:S-adenosylmethionine:tRNA ribosyltransferase-isomerase
VRRRSSRTTFPKRESRISDDERSTAAYDYELPSELIAQHPAPRRDASRLLVLSGGSIAHRTFADLPGLLRRGDLLVLNETRVIPARLFGVRDDGGRVELLLLHPADGLRYDPEARRWIALSRPARRLREGTRIAFGELGEAVVTALLAEGMREVELRPSVGFEEFLARAGVMPLPPYIHTDPSTVGDRYQTVFARVPGSVAAPTASLHFTPEVLSGLEHAGVEIARVSLNVGLGTFRPVNVERVDRHEMHAEAYEISPAAAQSIERARTVGRRVVAAGTTVVRALEGNVAQFGRIEPGEHATSLFIRPGFRFAAVDAMITNFHLPRSTLLMLVSAFAGRQDVLRSYREAIAHGYRFYSFGDAMLVER